MAEPVYFSPYFIGSSPATTTKRGGGTSVKERMAILGKGDTGQFIAIQHQRPAAGEWFLIRLAGKREVYVKAASLLHRTSLTREQIVAGDVTQLLVDLKAKREEWACPGGLVRGEELGTGNDKAVYRARMPKREGSLKVNRVAEVAIQNRHSLFKNRENPMAERFADCPFIVDPATRISKRSYVTTLYDLDGAHLERCTRGEKLTALTDVARGLARLHVEGLVHQDVKPVNLFFRRRDGRLRGVLGDLGFVAEVGCRRGATAGYYEASRYRDADKPADVWAFGQSLREIFLDDTVVEDLANRMQEPDSDRMTIEQVIDRLEVIVGV